MSDAFLATPTAAQSAQAATDNERPLVEDIRLLGCLLGDVIPQQEGLAAFELIEQIRQLSVAFRRDAEHAADKALKKLLKGLSGDQTVSVIRAFTYFSHLVNLAEDRHHIRRRAAKHRLSAAPGRGAPAAHGPRQLNARPEDGLAKPVRCCAN